MRLSRLEAFARRRFSSHARDGDKIRNIRFTGGCNGNLKAIAKLCEGMRAEDIAAKLLGNTCGGKPTSCADQLARAVLGKEA